MKKVLFGLMAFAIGMFSSCSNDEIAVDAVEAPVTDAVTITIDLTNFYSSYNYDDTWHDVPRIAEAYRTFNSEYSKYIQVRTYVYNRNTEELADSIVHYVTTTNSVTSSITLNKGDYYAITTVSFAENTSSAGAWWHVYDREKLSTAKLYPRNRYSIWSILSQSTESFSVKRGDHAIINTTPAPLGALVYFLCQNFEYKDEASYGTIADNGVREIALYTRRKTESYNMDPSATSKYNYYQEGGADYWYYDLYFEPSDFVDGTWTFFKSDLYGYCYILDPQQTNCFGVTYDGKTSFTMYGEQETNFISGKTYLAYWDYFKIGNPYLGIADNNHWNSYTVPTPTGNTYFEEPYLGWGESKSSVKTQVQNMGYTINSETDDYFVCDPKNKEKYTQYNFESGVLYSSYVFFDSSVITFDELNSIIAGTDVTYDFTSDSGSIFYTKTDKKSWLVVGGSDASVYVGYYDNSQYTTRARSFFDKQEKMEKEKSIKEESCLRSYYPPQQKTSLKKVSKICRAWR